MAIDADSLQAIAVSVGAGVVATRDELSGMGTFALFMVMAGWNNVKCFETCCTATASLTRRY
jgi:hypothetical protein